MSIDDNAELMESLEAFKKIVEELLDDEDANELFDMEGKDNELSDLGDEILKYLMSEDYEQDSIPYENVVKGKPTLCLDFYKERERCLKKKVLFEDPEFPADMSSIYPDGIPKDCSFNEEDVHWLRPADIVRKGQQPQLIVNDASRSDAMQGELGDCYMIAAAATLAMHEELFYRVVPPDQSFTKKYAGIFHFQFWRYGHWVDVVIDDLLPTVRGRLLYMSSGDANEFWSALLEKAYAKMYGSYSAIIGGLPQETLEDFTGGLTESYELEHAPKQALWSVLNRALEAGSLLGCSVMSLNPDDDQEKTKLGLVTGHAYTIVDLQKVTHCEDGDIDMIRIRNPWGNATQWKGAWGPKTKEWEYVSDEEKKRLDVRIKGDGEFWMSFNDFMKYFYLADICTIGPESMAAICKMTGKRECSVQANVNWVSKDFHGQWSRRNQTDGGHYRNTKFSNPQYLLTISDAETETLNNGKRTVIFAMMQKYVREKLSKRVARGITVYRAHKSFTHRATNSDITELSIHLRPAYVYDRDITKRTELEPGQYLILLSTYYAATEAEYLLRVLVNGPMEIVELQKPENPKSVESH